MQRALQHRKFTIYSALVYMARYEEFHKNDPNFELRTWEICGQDFVADICLSVDVFLPLITFLIQLQGVGIPIWKASVWVGKVTADLKELSKLRVNFPPESCFHLASNISDIKKTSHGQKLVEGWLVVGIEGNSTGQERSEILSWKLRQLHDVERDLQNLANLKNTLKIILWTPKYVHVLSRWLKFITTTDNGQVC